MERRWWSIAGAVALAFIFLPAGTAAQGADGWKIAPGLGLSFNGDYYDDLVVTRFADGDTDVDHLEIDPGAAVGVALGVEYGLAEPVSVYARVGRAWSEARVRVDGEPEPDIDLTTFEVTAGALLRPRDLALGDLPLPVHFTAGLGVFRHTSGDLRWEGDFTDFTTTSAALSGGVGVEYPVGPGVTVRAEFNQTMVRGRFGGLGEQLAAAAARDEGQPARTELEASTSLVSRLEAALAIGL